MMHHWMTGGMQFTTMYNVAQCNALMWCTRSILCIGGMHKVDDRRDGGWMLQSYLS